MTYTWGPKETLGIGWTYPDSDEFCEPVPEKVELDAQGAGVYPMSWDGLDDAGAAVPDGAYTVQVAASDANGQPVSAGTLTSGHINSIAYTSEGLRLNLALGQKISLLDIRQVM